MKSIGSQLLMILLFSSALCASAQEKKSTENQKPTAVLVANDLMMSINTKVLNVDMSLTDFKSAVFGISSPTDQSPGLYLQSFKIKYPGHQPLLNKGNTLNPEAIDALSDVKTGDHIVIYEGAAEAKNQLGSVMIKKPIIITVTD